VLAQRASSPGRSAVLVLVPEHDLAFAAFGNSAAAAALHDRVLLWLLRDYIGLDVPDVIATASAVSDLSAYAGTYCSDQLGVDVRHVDVARRIRCRAARVSRATARRRR
jgi:hypothetical protein